MPSGPGKTVHKMLASHDRFRNGLPERLPDGFTLTKTNGDPSHYAVCEVWTHPAGWELRLTANPSSLPKRTCAGFVRCPVQGSRPSTSPPALLQHRGPDLAVARPTLL